MLFIIERGSLSKIMLTIKYNFRHFYIPELNNEYCIYLYEPHHT